MTEKTAKQIDDVVTNVVDRLILAPDRRPGLYRVVDPAETPVSEMVERVALAISGSDDPANILSIHRSRARAAIEAMREPTERMLGAGYGHCGETSGSDGPACSLWHAMIDEALK